MKTMAFTRGVSRGSILARGQRGSSLSRHRLSKIFKCVPRSLSMKKAPEDRAQRAEPENDGSAGLNPKTSPALLRGLRIAGHVEEAAGDPDEAEHGRDGIADIDRKQPERGQENRHPFHRVHLHAKHPLQIRPA